MTTPAQPPAKGKGKKSGLNSPMTWVIVLGVGLVAGAFLLWRQKGTAAAASTATPQPNNEDVAGQIATLQGEIGDLQSTGAQDEAAESGTGTTTTPVPPAGLAAPGGLSITPNAAGANFGWGKVAGARAYELQVTGAGGHGTGTSHYDHAGADNHAEGVHLAKGKYRARVRAGTSTATLSGPWTAYKPFTVTGKAAAKPPSRPGSKLPGSHPASGGSEGED